MTECHANKREALRETKNNGASNCKETGEVKERGDSPYIGKKRIQDLTSHKGAT